MENKMTNKKALEVAIKRLENDKEMVEVVEKLNKMLTQLENKKSTKSNKPSKTSEENKELAKEVYEVLKTKDKMTVTEILKAMGWIERFTTSKMTAILNADSRIQRTIEKGKSKYFIAE